MVKSSVRVIIRTRPTANFASKNITIDEDKGVSPPPLPPFRILHALPYIA